jgi:hypothetical protein
MSMLIGVQQFSASREESVRILPMPVPESFFTGLSVSRPSLPLPVMLVLVRYSSAQDLEQ